MADEPPLLASARRLAEISADRGDEYRWISRSCLLMLRQAEHSGPAWNRAPFVWASQFIHRFEASTVDLATGAVSTLATFNHRFGRNLIATPVHVHFVDEDGNDRIPAQINYRAPRSDLSSDSEWLLWRTMRGWTAARLDGAEELRWKPASLYGHAALWIPYSHRWVELASELDGDRYRIRRLLIHRLNDPSKSRVVTVGGLQDGLTVGITSRNSLLMRHPGFG